MLHWCTEFGGRPGCVIGGGGKTAEATCATLLSEWSQNTPPTPRSSHLCSNLTNRCCVRCTVLRVHACVRVCLCSHLFRHIAPLPTADDGITLLNDPSAASRAELKELVDSLGDTQPAGALVSRRQWGE